ncbi:asparagine synthase (glutamine-hydrolyzing) [Polluticoccus soli]|uniref:asparagine synthase (glutamine-hydrolyzing) n=1 Tax=Polluticoccus soli TaxID=3034150 RepID=UPI0023E21AE9|nr:asparagine synthase (glutamine-hydrolyzing) [Flavipsychrobacter sp. JY13-12]
MCGIAGIVGNVANDVRTASLQRMSDSLAHRGPDGKGFYADSSIGLAHTRLSIIDLSEQGNQPLFNEDKSLVLVCNGEIYNYKSIRNKLVARGHLFASNSDCEVILHLYEEHKADLAKVLSELTGMFAFALWDTKRQQLLVARDRIGIKPLYFGCEAGLFVFASEVASVASSGLISCSVDETSLYEYFMLGSIPGPHTLYKTVKALPAGHFAVVSAGGVSLRQYWDIPLRDTRDREDNLVEEAEALFSEVVKDHLVADVPVGTFLSAGIDSSLITEAASQHQGGIHSFTASFPGEPEDEGIIAASTAKKLGSTFHSYKLTSGFFRDFEHHFQHIDQPFGISSALSLGRISEMACSNIKVALSGDGADELFAGYSRHEAYWQPPFLKRIPVKFQKSVVAAAAGLTRNKGLRSLNENLKLTEGEKFSSRIQVIAPSVVSSLLSEDVMRRVDTRRYVDHLDRYFSGRNDRDSINRMLYVDMKTTLIDEMLTKCDRMTMRHRIEGRVPFLDHRFVEFAFSMSSQAKRENGVGKVLLRKMVAKKLGEQLAYRKKTGFNAPLSQWLQTDGETTSYSRSALTDLSHGFIKNEAASAIAGNMTREDPRLIFHLVCFNQFFKK